MWSGADLFTRIAGSICWVWAKLICVEESEILDRPLNMDHD